MGKGSVEIKGYERGYSCLHLEVSGNAVFSGTLTTDARIVGQRQNLILSASDTSKIYISGNLETEEGLLVKSNAIISGNLLVGGNVWDLNSNLILSSAIGSVIAASGSLDFPNQDKTYHIRAVNGDLILSCSVGDIAFSAALKFQNVRKNAQVSAFDSHLILSSTAGSNVAISGALVFPASSKSAHIVAKDEFLILSSSNGSIVSLSSSLSFPNSDKNFHIRALNNDLILSSSSTSKVVISGTNLTFTDQAVSKCGHISTKNNHLILSGTTVMISGTINIDPTVGNWLMLRGAGLVTSGRIVSFGTAADETFGVRNSLFPNIAFRKDAGFYGNYKLGWLYSETGGNDNFNICLSGCSDSRTIMFSSSVGDLVLANASGLMILSSALGSKVKISGNLETNGFSVGYVEKLAQYTATANDYFIKADATSGSFGIVLPTAVAAAGKVYIIKKVDNVANVIVSGTAPQTIDGATIQTISSQWAAIQVISDGTNWLKQA